MVEVTGEFTRPNIRVPFYTPTEEWLSYFKDTYIKTGLRTGIKNILSDDRLTLRIVSTWRDADAYNQMVLDSYTQAYLIIPRKTYCFQNGITISSTSVIISE